MLNVVFKKSVGLVDQLEVVDIQDAAYTSAEVGPLPARREHDGDGIAVGFEARVVERLAVAGLKGFVEVGPLLRLAGIVDAGEGHDALAAEHVVAVEGFEIVGVDLIEHGVDVARVVHLGAHLAKLVGERLAGLIFIVAAQRNGPAAHQLQAEAGGPTGIEHGRRRAELADEEVAGGYVHVEPGAKGTGVHRFEAGTAARAAVGRNRRGVLPGRLGHAGKRVAAVAAGMRAVSGLARLPCSS